MIKILFCCAGGFSSSSITTRLQKELIDNNMQADFYIEYSPFMLAIKRIPEFDILVCCPHLRLEVDKLVKESNPDIPIYILPPRMYGVLKFKDLAFDVIDIIELYNKTKSNPSYFPGEERIISVTRGIAHRNYRKSTAQNP